MKKLLENTIYISIRYPFAGIYGDRFQGSLMPPLVRSPAMINTDWVKRKKKKRKKIKNHHHLVSSNVSLTYNQN